MTDPVIARSAAITLLLPSSALPTKLRASGHTHPGAAEYRARGAVKQTVVAKPARRFSIVSAKDERAMALVDRRAVVRASGDFASTVRRVAARVSERLVDDLPRVLSDTRFDHERKR